VIVATSEDAKGGRPPRVPGEEVVDITVRVTRTERERYKEAARLHQQTLADYIRVTVGGAAEDDLAFARDQRQRTRRRVQVDIAVERRLGSDRRG
jgi:hypothetical protein